MTNKEQFIKQYTEEVLDSFLGELLYDYDCDDELCDDEGCRSKKLFLQWLKYYKLIKESYERYNSRISN